MKFIYATLYLITTFLSHTTFTMDRAFQNAYAEYHTVATISERINRICGDAALKELNSGNMLEIIACITQCYPGITITRDLINDLCAKNSFFGYAIKHHILSAVQNYNHVTWDTLPIVQNPQAQQPVHSLNKLAQPIKEYVMLAAQHQSALRIEKEKYDDFYLLNTAINNTTHTIPARHLYTSPVYFRLKLSQRHAIQKKLVEKNIAVKKAELELKQICANRNVLRADLQYNF